MFDYCLLIFQKFVGKLVTNMYNSFDIIDNVIPKEAIIDRYGREFAMHWACKTGNKNCLNDVQIQMTGVEVPKGLEYIIYCNGLKSINKQEEWVKVWKMMQSLTSATERMNIIRGLGCSDDEEVIRDYLDTSITGNSDVVYSSNERIAVFESVFQSSIGFKTIMSFVTKFDDDIPF